MKLLAVIQARYESERFPGKVLEKYKEITFLEILLRRLKKSTSLSKVIVATSKSPSDKKISQICKNNNIYCYKGSESDVIDRFYKVSKKFKAKNIVRITADCPLIDYKLIDKVAELFFSSKVDYATNTMPPTFPDGYDVEIFNFRSLRQSWLASRRNKKLREHVTTYMREKKTLRKANFSYGKDYSFLRLTLDEPSDLIVIKKVLENFLDIYSFGVEEVIKLFKKKNFFFKTNAHLKRNEGINLNKGQKYWIRAKQIIPGGSMLFSKNPDLFLPKKWPAYFSKSKGCKIWDLEGKCFNDLSLMGLGTNVLGYNNSNVENKVIKIVKMGTMTTLNSIEEIKLAEKLVEIHPWAKMARFTRSGGEANSVAIRIARAASGKDNIAVCGYHGWHDWYLSCNLADKNNLNEHLMNKVPIKGVPKFLQNSVYPFQYNNFEQLKKIVERNNIGTIKMEVQRNEKPKNNFLNKVRHFADKKKIILIFDECTSGFRQTLGGLHNHYKVNPDIAIFGKALGNGYAINAIIGKKEIMEVCNSTFISSTFWTERIGSTAALATIQNMEKNKSWEIINKMGLMIKNQWKKISDENNIPLDIGGINGIPNFRFKSKNHLIYKTYISQEMLKRKILASNTIYCSIAHNKKLFERYFNTLNEIFNKIKKFETEKENVFNYLDTNICLSGLREKND